jgi:hypothetical protein
MIAFSFDEEEKNVIDSVLKNIIKDKKLNRHNRKYLLAIKQ